jgi:hypothetical protein
MVSNPDSLASGLYTATVTDANGCTSSASLTMTVDGLEEWLTLEGVLFPVPVQDVLTISLSKPLTADARVAVRDVQGRLIHNVIMRQGQSQGIMDATTWPSGVYNLQIESVEGHGSWNFVK